MNNMRLILTIVLIGAIYLALATFFQRNLSQWKFDTTEDKIYTLTDGTKEIISQVNKPIKLKFYYSRQAATRLTDKDRAYTDYYNYLRWLLMEYAARSNGMLQLEEIDPIRFSHQEEEAIRNGIFRLAIDTEQGFYFGLVAQSSLGRTETIAHFHPARQNQVEYDISSLIGRLIANQRKKIGIMSSLPIFAPEQGWLFPALLSKRYDIVPISTRIEEIKDIDLLMIIHPRRLDAASAYAVDQFILQGGPCMLFVDPFCVADKQGRKLNVAYSQLNQLTGAWGVELLQDFFAGDRQLAQQIATDRGSNYGYLLPLLGLRADGFNQQLAATANMGQVNLLFPGVLRLLENTVETINIEPILQTTAQGSPWQVDNPELLQDFDFLNVSTFETEQFQRSFPDDSETVTMAYYLSGRFPSAMSYYGDGLTITPENTKSRLAIFADVDMLSNEVAHFDSQGNAINNINLLESMIDFMLDSEALIAARNRGGFVRPFDKIVALQAKSQQQAIEEIQQVKAELLPLADELRSVRQKALANDPEISPADYAQAKAQYQARQMEIIRKIREIENQRNQQIQAIGQYWRNANMFIAPGMVLLVGIIVMSWLYISQGKKILCCADCSFNWRDYRAVLILALIATGAYWLMLNDKTQSQATPHYLAGQLLQGLDLNEIVMIEIANQGNFSTIVFDAAGNAYLQEKGNYPADIRRVNEMLAGWLGINIKSFLSDDSAAHQDMNLTEENAIQSIKFYGIDDQGQQKFIAGVLTGRHSPQAGGVFVRMLKADGIGNDNVYVANDVLAMPGKAFSYMERKILEINSADIISLEYQKLGQHLRIMSDADGNIFKRGFEPSQQITDDIARNLLYLPVDLRFVDVWPSDDVAVAMLDFKLNLDYLFVDEMVFSVQLAHHNGSVYARFRGSYRPLRTDIPEPQRQQMQQAVQYFNDYHRQWIYMFDEATTGILLQNCF